MAPPSLVLIPGASATPEFYARVLDGVRARNHDIHALQLPSVAEVSPPGPPPTMYDDAAHIQSHVTKLVDAGKDVVIFAHSYGGTPSTESIKGLSKKERERKGLSGGVVGLAYITALLPELGQPAGVVTGTKPASEKTVPMEVDENGWFFYPDIPKLAAATFSDTPREEGERLATRLVKHSAATFAGPLTYPGFKDVAVSYLKCLRDVIIEPEIQQREIDMIERESGAKVDVTEVEADHAAPWSRPQPVIDWVVRVAEKHTV